MQPTNANASTPGPQSHRPSGMDRRIEKSFLQRYWKFSSLALAALIVVMAITLWPEQGRSLVIDNSRIDVSRVTEGKFDDFIPLRGRVTPLSTIYLDSVEGGRVEKVHVEDGERVEAGDLLVELSNTDLQLDVISREAQVTEQLNALLTQELELERNKLKHERDLVEIDYQVLRLERLVKRRERQAQQGNIPRADLEDVVDELDYYRKRRSVTLNSQRTDLKLQKAQLQQLRENAEQLQKNLRYARKNLEALNVRAPASGKLTAFNAETGQSLARGERLGQIDNPGEFKLVVEIDEYYLNRVDLEQLADLEISQQRYDMRIAKIYPQVSNGRFRADLVFGPDTPFDIRRGQSFQLRLFLGDTSEALLIPNGAFFQDTGGKWVFVVTEDGRQAVRRSLKPGRRNTRYIEILDGLEDGERVITSPYTNFIDMQRLLLSSP